MKELLEIQRLRGLLQLEHDSEKEEYRLQMEEMGVERRVNRGLCWWPVGANCSYYNSLNQLVVEITKEREDDIDHSFEHGKTVVFFEADGEKLAAAATLSTLSTSSTNSTNSTSSAKATFSTKARKHSGFSNRAFPISFVEGNRMVVVIDSAQTVLDLQNAEGLGVQLYFDETSYKTMFHALDEVLKAKNNRLATLRSIFAGLTKPSHWTFGPQRFPWLNASQEKAVNEVLRAKDVAVVHGPPGTGKTTTMVEAIYETLKRETQVMVCAQSNMAVDWISEKLVDHGVPVLRIGNPTRVNDKMLSFTYERKFESHPDYPELWNIRRTIRQIQENRKKGEQIHQKISRLRERASEIEYRIKDLLFSEARVIACTLVGSDNRLLIGQKFPTLFIDEAAQAMEPACWIAIRRANRVILAGDHKQLPPTIKCYEALKQGLGVTLMERIAENVPQCVTMLKMQYRMHEDIMRFSSHWFYDDSVESAPSVKNRSILELDNPISWIEAGPSPQVDTDPSPQPSPEGEGVGTSVTENADNVSPLGEKERGGEAVRTGQHGYFNQYEAELTISTLEQYVNRISRRRFIDENIDIGIISPYRMQIQLLRTLIKKSQVLKPIRKQITVNTIDGFQGQERDIIVISLVRSNDKGEIGFLGDLRRMNVAMTRARMKLIILGDSTTLSRHPFYRQLLKAINPEKG